MVIFGWVIAFSDHGHFVESLRSRGGIWFPLLIASIPALLYAAWLEVLFANQTIFDERRALWIEKGELVFLNRFYFRRYCADIADVIAGNDARQRKVIVVSMIDGSQKAIPCGAFKEEPSQVILKLKASLSERKEVRPDQGPSANVGSEQDRSGR